MDLKKEPSPVQLEDAKQYLASNKVMETLKFLMMSLLTHRPDDPHSFMVAKLQEMRSAKVRGQSLQFYSRDNLSAIFRILDSSNRGHINLDQYTEGMKTIGAVNFNPRPMGGAKILMDTFIDEAQIAMARP
ncbi:uncharacterized protein BJ171DRAFT_489594 [Polychytrium aggregatum]|uniref:uncharacterized protein n=1 Tax=Polychytrium aggregatum TaxID=110093 RepID=UPI0022FE6CCF|nr:uncharacterized protein BJ171DRAFT_489594 [Polychytrium aggregatum]KAI9208658.1 hypothetical protein BJ171DRAFT_489594 [Polychytrium aggregatum]